MVASGRGFLRGACALILVGVTAPPLPAQDLIYRPINPSFGGNPLNSAHLLAIATAQRTATAGAANRGVGAIPPPAPPGQADADLFVRQLQGRLLSALAAQVTEAIFGPVPQDSGVVTFGTTTITFERTPAQIRLVIADNLAGTVTEIVVPQLVTGTPRAAGTLALGAGAGALGLGSGLGPLGIGGGTGSLGIGGGTGPLGIGGGG